MRSTLYITRNGMLEPLGQSQVLAYLRGLSDHYCITLISFEKPEDWADETAVRRIQEICESHDIRWLPQRFHYRPKVIAPAWCMLMFLWLCLREIRRGNAELIHARSYIPTAVAMVAGRLTGTPFIFDMRALWPEELITAGRLKRGSAMHRAIAWAERSCLKRAAAVVSLTHAAVGHLKESYPKELASQRVVVIPTCADLGRFVPPSTNADGPPIYSCIGTVLSGWFRGDWLRLFFEVVAEQDTSARFEIVTRDDLGQVRETIDPNGLLGDRLLVYACDPANMPEVLQRHTSSVMFYAGGCVSELGRSPTRMAEILGCGLPVIANAGVGDVEEILTKHQVGVLVEDAAKESMVHALNSLNRLSEDPNLAKRCRSAAQSVYSLGSGTDAYLRLYQTLLGDSLSPSRKEVDDLVSRPTVERRT